MIATLLIAVFVELSEWSTAVNAIAAFGPIAFFAGAIAGYCVHGWRRDTDNQFRDPVPGTHAFMWALIVVEIGGFAVLLAGFDARELDSDTRRLTRGAPLLAGGRDSLSDIQQRTVLLITAQLEDGDV